MQFFPAALSHGAHFLRTNGVFEMTETRAGQDFSELLCTQMDPPVEAVATPQTDQPPASFDHEEVSADDRGHDEELFDDVSSGREDERICDDPDTPENIEIQVQDDVTETAKAAEQQPQTSNSGQEDFSIRGVPEDSRPASDKHAVAQDSDVSDDSLADEVQAVLDGLSNEAKGQIADPEGGRIKAEIEALHELLRQFREGSFATRSEMVVALGAQIKSLKAELAATAERKPASSESAAQKTQHAARASSGAMQKLDALLHRLEAYRASGHRGQSVDKGRIEVGASVAAETVTMKAEDGGRSRMARISTAAKAALREAAGEVLTRESGAAPEIEATAAQRGETATRSTKRDGRVSDTVSGRPGTRHSAQENSAGKKQVVLEATENFLPAEDRHKEPVVSGADRKSAAGKDQDNVGRNETVMARSGLVAAANRTSVTKDGSGQTVLQDSGSGKHEGAVASPASAVAAESKGGKNAHDARQGFFGSSDREKNSSSTSRSAQTLSGTKSVPESLSQSGAQNLQNQFQQRLESPVSARSAQVYQQVESGAFKNLGQGIKQLVIRLDPADLGQVSVILQVRGKEVQAVLRSSSQEASLALNEQLGQLRTQLEAQGLKVGKLEVQMQLADSQGESQWQGAQNHNRYQENQELAMSAKRWRTLERVSPDLVRDVQNSPQREKLSQSGLDIFA